MDAYSINCTSESLKHSSKIYQDLWSSRLQSFASPQSNQRLMSLTMDTTRKYNGIDTGVKPHVAVVGAGLAGLRCADILTQHGFRVTMIEGRNRLGGRMLQQRLSNGRLVDLGPNWIHGTSDNPMLELAKQTGTAVGSPDARSYVYDEFGKILALEESEALATIMWDIIQDAFKHSNRNWTTIPVEESLWDFFVRMVPERIPESEEDFESKRRVVFQIAESWGAFVGSPVASQSLKYFWLEECIEGENLFCADTYSKILDLIAAPAKQNATIMYDTRVERIRTKTTDHPKPTVSTSSGETLEFDEVVLTAPLGWLKKNLDAFEPKLPGRLEQGIKSIGYGCLEKVYISFPKAFWLDPNPQGCTVQGFCQWLSPTYAPETNPNRWNQEIVELASSGPETGHATLLFYIYGAQSEHVTSGVRSAKTTAARDAFLAGFFKPYYSRLPNYDAKLEDCRPEGFLATDWLHDELAGHGSYSNFQVGLEHGDKDVRVMREGAPEQGLWLAGEHTAPFVALGTATGAYWSGESVGRRIAEWYGYGFGGEERKQG